MLAGSTKGIYLHGLFASLAQLVVISVYSLLVIRLSLDYLGKDEFGLLTLVSQVSNYIAVIDLGLFTAFSRILIDYTTGSTERYANGLKTATRIFHVLGVGGMLVAIGVAFVGSGWLGIPVHLHREFVFLMLAQGVMLLCTFSLKPITAPLVANGKHYYVYWLTSGLTVINALIFWLALRGGIGIYSSLLASTVVLCLNAVLLWRMARPYLDVGGVAGRFDRTIFKEVSAFARDSMFWQIGGQTLASLPVILAAAWFALGASADLSGGMKLILLMVSVCTRFADMAVTPLSIQFARGNESAAADQMTRIAGLSGGIGACGALFLVCVNPAFIAWWMLDKISWSWHANVFGALWVAVLSVTQCMYGYAVVCRRMGIIRWALIGECLLYVMLALFLRPWAGVSSLLWAKALAATLICAAVAYRIGRGTEFDTRQLVPVVCRQALVLGMMIPVCLSVTRWIGVGVASPLLNLMACGLLAIGVNIVVVPILFPQEMRTDILRVARGILPRRRPKSAAAVANVNPLE